MEREGLRARLAALLPRSLWPIVEAGGGGERREGCVLFADIAGFTPLTGSLARIGKEGAEELTRILNDFFAAMIAIVHSEGGDVLRFGGDAMTLFFPSGPEAGLRAARRMQEETARFQAIETRGGSFALGMKIGVATGPVLLGTVGDDTTGRDYFASGSALDAAAEAEHRASKGQIVLSPGCLAAVAREPAGLLLLEDGFGRLEGGRAPGRDAAAQAAPPCRTPSVPPLEALERFLPKFMAEKAALEEGLSVAEHRRTTVLFLAFAGIDWDADPEAIEKVREVYRRISQTVRDFGGWVNKLDMGDKGSKVIGLFGAPYALENQEEAACRAALAILADGALRSQLTDLRIGITASPLFAAYVGADDRREYTVMGDGINMAARLMANAHSWRVLCGQEVRDRAAHALAFRELDPIFVKGKAEKVTIFRPEGDREEVAQEVRASFVGRADLRARLLPRLLSPEAPLVLALVGEPGVGKTALLHQLGHDMGERGVRHITVPLVAHSVHSYLSAWRPVLFAALGVSRNTPATIREEALRAAAAREDPAYLALFNGPLGTQIPETEASRALSAKDRKDVLFAMLVRLFTGLAAGGPYGIFLDHLEYADPASGELLKLVASELGERPLKLLAAFRTQSEAGLADVAGLFERQAVGPFSPEEIQEYLTHVAGAAPPPGAVQEFLVKRTGGNPKFLEQILEAMQKAGVMAPGPSGLLEVDEDRLAVTHFPETLEGLLLSRADGLPEAQKSLLKAASVLGASFSVNLLRTLLDQPMDAVLEAIHSLEERGILKMDTWGQRPYATFFDSLLRDALYESLNFSVKRAFHARIATLLEQESAQAPRLWPALARHFEAAGNEERARHYLWSAAEEARARYDNAQAFQFLSRFVELSDKAGASPADDIRFRKGLVHLAEASKDLGRLDEADAFSQRVLDAVAEPCPETVVSLMRLADNQRRRGALDESLETYGQAQRQAELIGDRSLKMKITSDLGVPLAMSGQMDKAMQQFKQAENLARGLNEPGSLVLALMNQGLCHYQGSGDFRNAVVVLRRAMSIGKRHKLRPRTVNIALNLAQALFDQGEYTRALALAEDGVTVAKQFGYRDLYVALQYNVALYQCTLGMWDHATKSAQVALGTATHHGMTYYEALNTYVVAILNGIGGAYAVEFEGLRRALALHLSMRRRIEGVGCLSEILMLTNQLKLFELASESIEEAAGILGAELAESEKAWNIGLRAQLHIRAHSLGNESTEATWQGLERALSFAEASGTLWLTAEVGEALTRFLLGEGKNEQAAVAATRILPVLLKSHSAWKVAPFLLSLAEALIQTDRDEALRDLMPRVKRYSVAFDRGLMGLRYRLLLMEVAQRKGRTRAASREGTEARAMAATLVGQQDQEPFRSAVLALPEVRRALAFE